MTIEDDPPLVLVARATDAVVYAEARPWRGVVHASDLTAAIGGALWILSMRRVNPAAMTDYGLVPALPFVYFAALAVLLVGFAIELGRRAPSSARLAIHVGLVITVIHGTVPAVFPLPHFAWVYKHLGVIKFIAVNGRVSSGIDPYHNWPGFFTATAWLSSVAGLRDPIALAKWAELLMSPMICVQLLWVSKALGAPRRTRWLAAMVFVLANWVGQDYLAPQAVAFILALGFFGVVLTWLTDDPPPTFAIGIALVLFSAIVVTHQLTPYLVIGSVGVLTIFGRVRPRWLVMVMLVEAVAYFIPHYASVSANLRSLFFSGFDFFSNARNNAPSTGGQPGRLATAHAARILSLAVWGLAGVGAVRRLRSRAPTFALIVLAATPLSLLLAFDYGGEAVFRVYLFSSPWCALLVASAVAPRATTAPLRTGLGGFAVCLLLAPLLLQAYFGNEQMNRVWPSDLAAADYFYTHAPSGSALLLVTSNFPLRDSARYDEYKTATGEFGPNLASRPSWHGVRFDAATLPRLESAVRRETGPGHGGFIAVSAADRPFAAEYKLFPSGSIDRLDRSLAGSSRWRAYFRDGPTVIYELVAPSPSASGQRRDG